MKFTDENGVEIECTPEEYIQLSKLKSKKEEPTYIRGKYKKRKYTPQQKPKSYIVSNKPLTINGWNNRMEKIATFLKSEPRAYTLNRLLKTLNLPLGNTATKMRKMLAGHNIILSTDIGKWKCYYHSIHNINDVVLNDTRKVPKKYKKLTKQAKKTDGRVVRMRFISKRTAWLQKHYQWSREKSMTWAAQEWNRKGKIEKVQVDTPLTEIGQETIEKKTKILQKLQQSQSQKDFKVVEDFPTIYRLENNNIKEGLKQHISQLIANKTRLGYFDIKELCGFNTGLDWRYFINDFIRKKAQIANYFNVSDKFKHVRINGYDYLTYK
ncbi:MAG: hypothetical protein KAJ19_14760 [Gammaproteobacteria bacterium]|nr:hypothetical protein [Gammaproteobacteria bacterium]